VPSLSLKTKLSGTVCLLLAGLLALLGSATLHFFSAKFRAFIGHQQFAMVSIIAAGLDQQLVYGRQLIVATAASLPPKILADPDRTQAFLDQNLGLGTT
jgi:hypothetical protein